MSAAICVPVFRPQRSEFTFKLKLVTASQFLQESYDGELMFISKVLDHRMRTGHSKLFIDCEGLSLSLTFWFGF